MLATSATTLVLVAVPLQLLGLSSTCTQGADGTFITGAILSGPLLLVAASLLSVVAWRGGGAGRRWLLWVTCAALGMLVILTRDAWLNTILYGTPCGSDFAFYGGSDPRAVALIVGAYVVAPIVVASLAALGIFLRR